MLLDYNKKRKQQYDKYVTQKEGKEEEKAATLEHFDTLDHALQEMEYKGLMKKLGSENYNEDVRKKLVKKLTAKPENTLSPSMWLQVNPAYRMESNNRKTHFMETFTGKQEEDVDKVYFRKKDNLSDYAEALFRSKVFFSKK